MKRAAVYIHGKGGDPSESGHYKPFFPDHTVIGLEYKSSVPWEAGEEIRGAIEALRRDHESVTVIANSIGAYFAMCSGADGLVDRAFFISPVVDMEGLIRGMMEGCGVTEAELKEKGEIGGLSWQYLAWVRDHPVKWLAPTEMLFGENDELTPAAAAEKFAREHGAGLTVMPGGEHWFHTPEEMSFLDSWLTAKTRGA